MSSNPGSDSRGPSPEAVRAQLELILASEGFRDAQRSGRLLRYLVEETLAGRAQNLKEYTLGVDVLDRGASFDPRTDPIVRAEASRLRARLDQYYAHAGQHAAVLIGLPKGSYVPRFSEHTPGPAAARPRLARRTVLALAAWTVAALAVGGTLGWWMRQPSAPPGVLPNTPLRQMAFEPLPGPLQLSSLHGVSFAVTPDGSALICVAFHPDGSHRLHVYDFATRSTRELPGTLGARSPFISPDGQWVAFQAEGKLKRTRIDGTGSPLSIADAPVMMGGTWISDAQLVVSVDESALVRFDVTGGRRDTLYDSGGAERAILPQAVIGSNLVLYTALGGKVSEGRIDALDLRTGERKTVLQGGTFGKFDPRGYLLYLNNGAVYATRFEPRRLETVGDPVQVLATVAQSPAHGYAQLDLSSDGSIVFQQTSGNATLPTLVSASGATQALTDQAGLYMWPRVSPDGRQLAFSLRETSSHDIWTLDLDTRVRTRVTDGGVDFQSPVWSADGKYLFFGAPDGIHWSTADGGRRGLFIERGSHVVLIPRSVSPGTAQLAYYALDRSSGMDLWTIPVEFDGDAPTAGKPRHFVQGPAFDTFPAFSPDGQWIAYSRTDSGVWEVYVRHFPDGDRDYRISDAGGAYPVWSRSGTQLFFRDATGALVRAAVSFRGKEVVATRARPWTNIRLPETDSVANFDVLPGEQRVVAMLPAAAAEIAGGSLVLATGVLDKLARNPARAP